METRCPSSSLAISAISRAIDKLGWTRQRLRPRSLEEHTSVPVQELEQVSRRSSEDSQKVSTCITNAHLLFHFLASKTHFHFYTCFNTFFLCTFRNCSIQKLSKRCESRQKDENTRHDNIRRHRPKR